MNRIALAAVLCLTACVGPDGPEGRPGIVGPMGEQGEPGPGASAGISAVEPREVAVGLKMQVAISGVGTAWTDAASVSFGQEINVTKVRAASANALIVDVDVSARATVGARDISVVQGGGAPLIYKNVFQVVPLVTMTATGKAARGSLVSVVVTHHDPMFEFDTSWNGSAFTGVTATLSPTGVVVVRDVKPHVVTLLASLDIDTPLGQRDLRVVSSVRRPSEQTFSFPNVFEVADLNELALAGPTATGTLGQAFESALYKFTPTSTGTELLASVTTMNGKGAPMLVLVPTGGHFSSYSLSFLNSYTFTPYATTTDYRFVVVDPSNTPGVDYAVSVIAPTKVAEVEPNEAAATPMTVTVPSMVTPATLSSQTDIDFYKVVVNQGEVGRSLRIRTRAGDYSTDLQVELFRADGTPVMPPTDVAYHEDVRSPPLTAAGDYFVRLSWGRYTTSMWASYSSRYDLLLNWE